jgi:hypothetical protein
VKNELREKNSKFINFRNLINLYLDSPPPGLYEFKSDFDLGKPGSTSSTNKAGVYSFGIGREFYQKVYMPQRK